MEATGGLEIDFSKVAGLYELMALVPEQMATSLAGAFQEFGQTANEAIRANAAGGLHLRNAGTAKVFKFKAADAAKVKGNPGKLFVDFYTKWKATGIFEDGGTISASKAAALTILTDAARGPGGRRRWSPEQLRAMVASGKARIIKTPHGLMIAMDKGGLTKTGKYRKGSRTEILAIIKKSVKESKRINFVGTVESKFGLAMQLAEAAVEKTMNDLGKGN